MPAVSVDDVGSLPRLRAPRGARERPVVRVTHAPGGFEGEGFPVRRAFAGIDQAWLDPFVHMDEMGEVDYAPGEAKGTPWHPHRGFETVTYMIDGTFRHQDSTGGGGLITDGATQWMTAGAGILHIEAPPERLVASGGLFHGVQLWVNLPAASKWLPPSYQDLPAETVELLASPDAGALVRLIAGELDGHRGPGATRTPITLVHASLAAGAQLELDWPVGFNALGYALAGQGSAGPAGHPVRSGDLVVFGSGERLRVRGGPAAGLDVLLLGGAPIREPVAWSGPFVMNTAAELRAAFEDYRAGRMGHVPPVARGRTS